ncbi:hypothetical protein P9112_008799 [Eukaryota sp. TZLM1-RC]
MSALRSTASYNSTKANSRALDADHQRRTNAHKAQILFCLQFLNEAGFYKSVAQLETDSGLSLEQFDLADNLSLSFLLNFWFNHFETNYSSIPVLFKKKPETTRGPYLNSSKPKSSKPTRKAKAEPNNQFSLEPSIVSCTSKPKSPTRPPSPPPLNLGCVPEDVKDSLGPSLTDLLSSPPPLKFKEVIGLGRAKSVLFESAILPILKPKLFSSNNCKPPTSALLYGSPGCGKTLLARAVATEAGCAFISLSGSSLVSKWRGESEKVLRTMFSIARQNSPCVLFVDEIDCIFPKESDHEASRRLSAELLTQIDGVNNSLCSDGKVFDLFFLVATNRPYELDNALLRRLHRKIYVPPPNSKARRAILTRHLSQHLENTGVGAAIEEVVTKTEKWPASDLVLGVSESLFFPIRRNLVGSTEVSLDRLVGSDDEEGQCFIEEYKMSTGNKGKHKGYCGEDLLIAFDNLQPSFDLELHKFCEEWRC